MKKKDVDKNRIDSDDELRTSCLTCRGDGCYECNFNGWVIIREIGEIDEFEEHDKIIQCLSAVITKFKTKS